MKKIIILLLSIFSCLFVSASFDMNENMQNAYLSIIDLKFEKGLAFIEKEKQQNPNNGLIHLHENYKDFLALIIGEDEQLFDKISSNKSKRLSAIEKCDKTSPYYLYAKAEINLQWAFVRLKFQEYFLAAYEIQKAYFILKENQKKFPDFHLNKKGMGLLHCLIGSIPENYQWIVNAIGINGGIDKGLNELHQLLSLTEKDEQYKIYNTELLFLISFLEMNLTIEKSNFQKTLDAIGQKHANHILLNFSAARLSSRLGKNDLVIKILNNRPKKEEQFEFSYLDYLLGMSYLYKLDFESSMKIFHHFITHFKGENYIKSAYHKLAWIAFLQGEPEKKLSYFEKAIAEGSISIDEDKVALKDAKQNYITHPILLKGRLLYDGGYYPLALAELQQIESPHLFSNTENTIEYWYRKARLFQKMEKPIMEVISSFQKALDLELTSNSYYASMSALQIAIEYEKMGEKQKAKSYYNKCLSMKDFDYQRGIHQKAKAGLNRIAN